MPILAVLLLVPALAAAPSAAGPGYALEASTLTYHVHHLVHRVQGTSHVARGRGACRDGVCEFLIAVPLATFDSGDTNRDQHMLQCTRGGDFPLVSVRTTVKDDGAPEVTADLAVEFAGRKKAYSGVRFERTEAGGRVTLTGTIPLVLSDFGIERPSLLTVPIDDAAPVDVTLLWSRTPGR